MIETTRRVEDRDKRKISTLPPAGKQPVTSTPARHPRKPEQPRVGWIAATAIALMLLLGAGWELWRWLLLFIAMD
jgi:hypothetical protein